MLHLPTVQWFLYYFYLYSGFIIFRFVDCASISMEQNQTFTARIELINIQSPIHFSFPRSVLSGSSLAFYVTH